MTLDETIKSIEKKLSNSMHFGEFKDAYNVSIFDDERAYNLGLYFKQLKQDDFQIYIQLKLDLEYLRDFYDSKGLINYFSLKTSKIADTKISVWTYPLLIFAIFIITIGLIRQFNGLYTVALGIKKMPTYFTGLMWVIIGLALCWFTLAPIWRRSKYKKFYKKYNVNDKTRCREHSVRD